MKYQNNGIIKTLVLLLIFLPSIVQSASLVTSGRVAFMRGKVVAIEGASGATRQLKRDSRVDSGDVIKTGPKALAQIVFPDKTMFYIKASSEIKLTQYRYMKKSPDKDVIVTEILKGSMRALTGIVGKRNPDKVKFKTKVATIGIRGTALEIGESQVIFDYGRGYMTNEGGTTTVESGESAQSTNALLAAKKSSFKRPDSDAAVVALRLIEAPLADVKHRAGLICKQLAFEEAQLLVGIQSQIPGFKPEILSSTVEGLIVCIPPELIDTLITTSVLMHTEYAPSILKAAVDSKIPVAKVTKAVLRGLENPTTQLLNNVLNNAINSGLTKDEAVKIIKDVKEDPFCAL